MHTIVMVRSLPIPMDNRKIHHKQLDKYRRTTRELQYNILYQGLDTPYFTQNPGANCGYYRVLCTDGNLSSCKLVLAVWRADFPVYCNLHRLERQVCF
jgi:hypothetical protein